MRIESRNNPIVKSVRALSAGKERKAQGLHLVEGEKLVKDALASGAPVVTLFYEEGFDAAKLGAPETVQRIEVPRAVLESMADSRTPQGVLATVRTPDMTPPVAFPEGLIVLLDGVQDPGNVGAILRSADAFGAAALLLSADCADPFSPKAVRAAMGSTYHLPVFQGNVPCALDRLRAQGFTALCGHLAGSETLPTLAKKVALVIGSEGNGVSKETADRCVRYRLPMYGRAESLNAAVAAGILLYAVRERMEHGRKYAGV